MSRIDELIAYADDLGLSLSVQESGEVHVWDESIDNE